MRPLELSPAQAAALAFVHEGLAQGAEWKRRGKDAWGSPDRWDGMLLFGEHGSVLVPRPEWNVIRDLIDLAPPSDKLRMYVSKAPKHDA